MLALKVKGKINIPVRRRGENFFRAKIFFPLFNENLSTAMPLGAACEKFLKFNSFFGNFQPFLPLDTKVLRCPFLLHFKHRRFWHLLLLTKVTKDPLTPCACMIIRERGLITPKRGKKLTKNRGREIVKR